MNTSQIRFDLLTRQQLELVLKSGVADAPRLHFLSKNSEVKIPFGVPGFEYRSYAQWLYHVLLITHRVHIAPPFSVYTDLKTYASSRYTDFLEDIQDRDVPNKLILITVLTDLLRELEDPDTLLTIEHIGQIQPGDINQWLQIPTRHQQLRSRSSRKAQKTTFLSKPPI